MKKQCTRMVNRAELINKLILSYPAIYDPQFTFCVPDHWFENLNWLSIAINTILISTPTFKIEVSDVKEKHGGLRFYYSLQGPLSGHATLDQKIEVLIEQANERIQQEDFTKR